MSVALGRVQSQIYGADNTPSNQDNIIWFENAESFIDAANAITPSDNGQAEERVIDALNDANVKYKVFTSTYGEFGSSTWPSFGKAVYESIQELPTTVGDAVGGSIGTIVGGIGETVQKTLGALFTSLGIWGWLLLIVVGFAALTYFFPQWLGLVKGAVAK